MILVPVKSLSDAKQRLAPALNSAARAELARTMLFDVLTTLSTWRNRPEISLVTSDATAIQLAHYFRFSVIADEANLSETDAIATATALCESRGEKETLVIPGDIPLIQVWELERIFQEAPAEGSVLVPSFDGCGTNAALRSPAGLFPLRFGNDSFEPHLAAANATQKPCVVLNLPGIALDIDCPADLHELLASPGETRSQRLLRRWNLTELPLAANE
ncbi:MAG TPA: 2-phospho-L-lactate guanylyltransferase [Terriglobales bacterium]|nr:2-phospho-L-lactate guanylyltransferase [Terriglobales bacterium]